jgi:hypothetical protein
VEHISILELNFMSNKESSHDGLFYKGYWISWIIVAVVGLASLGIGLAMFGDISILGDLASFLNSDYFIPILTTLVFLLTFCFVIGWFTIAVVSKIGDEVILLVFWITPFVVAGISLLLTYQEQNIDYLGGTVVSVLFLIFVIYFRKSIRASARLVELGAEIVVTNPKMFYPAIVSMILKFIATLLMLAGSILVISILVNVHPIVAVIVWILYEIPYLFVMSVISSFSQATNIAYVQQWYTKPSSSPSLGQARGKIGQLKGPVARYAFLMTFVRMFKGGQRRQTGWTPFALGKYMKISDWPKLILGGGAGRSVTSTVAKVVEYLGTYTLVIIVSKSLKSVTQAYKESAKGVFGTFVTNIAGQIGLNIVDYFQRIITSTLLLVIGGVYGFFVFTATIGDDTNAIIFAIVFAVVFLLIGSIPLSGLFKPVTTSYQYVLYQSFMDRKSNKTLSSRLNKKTQSIIKAAFK